MVRREDEPDEEGSYKPISEHFPTGKPFPPAPIAAASAGKGCQVSRKREKRKEKTF